MKSPLAISSLAADVVLYLPCMQRHAGKEDVEALVLVGCIQANPKMSILLQNFHLHVK